MPHPGTVHKYTSRLIAFEHAPPNPPPTPPKHTILWLGGLSDGLLTVDYPHTISTLLPPTWTLAEVLLSSSYKGWGTGSLRRDARELGECVAYFKQLRGEDGKVVVMGHSTGCQDVMEYIVRRMEKVSDSERRREWRQERRRERGEEQEDNGNGENQEDDEEEEEPVTRPPYIPLDGAILQGGVSDREAWEDMMRTEHPDRQRLYLHTKRTADEMMWNGLGKEIIPRVDSIVYQEFNTPVTAYRTESLLRPGGDDDYFSTDLSDEKLASTFGVIPPSTPVLFLLGELDPYVPKSVGKDALICRWTEAIKKGGGRVDEANGGVVKGAHHNLNDDPDESVRDLAERVVRFLQGVEGEKTGEKQKEEASRL